MTVTDHSARLDVAGYPNGTLKWAQPGVYNADDDRLVITALSDNQLGVVEPVGVTALAGLQFSLAPGWLAIVPCGDGTSAVAASRQSFTIGPDQGVMAGPVVGTRADLLWLDADPDGGVWRISVIRESEMPGRSGIPLSRITVPAGANLASQMRVSSAVPSFGQHSTSPMASATTNAYADLTPFYPLPPFMNKRYRAFRVTAWGTGQFGNVLESMVFRPSITGVAVPEVELWLAGLGWSPGWAFSWKATLDIQCRWSPYLFASIEAIVRPGRGQGVQAKDRNGVTGFLASDNLEWNPNAWNTFGLQARFDGTTRPGQAITCVSATFESIEAWPAPGYPGLAS